jgi:hypothetical protein
MAMGRDCWCHRHRDDVPLEVHHVWPLGNGGPDIKANRVSVCSNAHSATHDLLSRMVKSGGRVPWTVRIRYGRRVRQLAATGYAAIQARTVIRL